MCKLIGIYGGGSEIRVATAWLMAQAIEGIIEGKSDEDLQCDHNYRVQCISRGQTSRADMSSTNHVVLDSFGMNILDQVKLFNPNLQLLDLCDVDIKFHKYVELSSMKVLDETELEWREVKTLAQMCEQDPPKIEVHWVMNINDYILYFADHVIKRYFGEEVWLNASIALNNLMGLDDYRIYWDVKTQSEVDYIKDSGGMIVAIREPEVRKGYRKIKQIDPNYILSGSDLQSTTKDLLNIVKQFLNN